VTTQVDVTGQSSVTSSGDDDRLAYDVTNEMIARLWQLLLAADAEPLAFEDARYLLGVAVGLHVPIAMESRFHGVIMAR
jgi:hypothetical protein